MYTDVFEPLLKPMQAHSHDHNIYEAKVSEDRDEVYVKLLVCLEIFDVDTEQTLGAIPFMERMADLRVQTRLSGCTGAKEVRVHRCHVAVGVDHDKAKQAHEDDPCIFQRARRSASCISSSIADLLGRSGGIQWRVMKLIGIFGFHIVGGMVKRESES